LSLPVSLSLSLASASIMNPLLLVYQVAKHF
jgi:hypothetical protein